MSLLAADWPEFVRVARITNTVTGADVPVDFEIHRDDVDWCVQLWQDSFMLDWQLYQATRPKKRTMNP